jgi:mRNA interferase MazF
MVSTDDLWLVDFGDPFPGEPAQHRPALVVGPSDLFGADFPCVIVVPLTTVRRGLSLHVEVEASPETGLDETCYAQCELIRSVSRKRLVHRIGSVGPGVNLRVGAVVKMLLDC